ncbi:Regulatory protein SoxS [Lutibaculum baratangense]|uniref:Regulatory protein SoxS n=1 Tax=Lutibaculum baratangense AMV1 TaxID=631454 RepID=V4TNJ3_9HYPH|nr:Regulatory protein SoxS [Lutibaculum baratangense]ESR27273.1 Regulatory protein SoxS [Lutibaculum baratangense AMV1]
MKALIALLLLLQASSPQAAPTSIELLMLEQPGCPWCLRWHQEIGQAYPRTPEGQRAPLRRIDISEPWPEDLQGVGPDRVTPTFILVQDGKEVARMRGYPGDQFFWPLLDDMFRRLQGEPAE